MKSDSTSTWDLKDNDIDIEVILNYSSWVI